MSQYKSFSGNWQQQLYYELSYTQDIRNNTTTYYVNNIQIGGGWAIDYTINQNLYFRVNDELKSIYIDRLVFDNRGWKRLGNLSWIIPHNANGEKRFTLAISCDLSHVAYGKYRVGSISHSEIVDLPRILRGAELTSTIPSELSTSNATFNATCAIHNSSFKTIMELSYDNPSGQYEWLGVTHEDKSNVTLTIPRNHLDKLVAFFPNQNYANIVFTLASRDRNTNENISVTQKVIKLNFGNEYNPTINSFNFEERKQEIKTLALPQNNYVQDLSLIVPIINASAKQNATIIDYEISYNDKVLNESTGAFTLKMDTNGQIAINLKITDSRGKQVSTRREINILPYHPPRILLFDVQRDSRNQEKPTISYQTRYSNILGKNNYSVLVQYSEKNKNVWNTAYSITNQYSVEKREDKYMLPITCKIATSYDFRMIITDKFNNSNYIDDLGMAIKPFVVIPKGAVVGGLPTNKKLHGLQIYGKLIDESEKLYLKQGMRQEFQLVTNFSSGVANYGSGYGVAMYCKDAFDRVFLQGHVKINGAPTGMQNLFTLPEGYRPKTVKYFTAIDDALNQGTVQVSPNGTVLARTIKNTNFICLDGISFVEGE